MPSRKVHNFFCKIFGIDEKLANKINRDIDFPSKFLGKKHRILFHDFDLSTILLLSKYKFSPEVLTAWYLHKLLDELSKDKKMKELFDILEKLL